jgi:hypothetical protein
MDYCPKCDKVSLTFRRKERRAFCHNCGFSEPVHEEKEYYKKFVYTKSNMDYFCMRTPERLRKINPLYSA